MRVGQVSQYWGLDRVLNCPEFFAILTSKSAWHRNFCLTNDHFFIHSKSYEIRHNQIVCHQDFLHLYVNKGLLMQRFSVKKESETWLTCSRYLGNCQQAKNILQFKNNLIFSFRYLLRLVNIFVDTKYRHKIHILFSLEFVLCISSQFALPSFSLK